MLTDALSLPETPVPVKVARLLLASDILHNSTAPVRNASRYRSLLEAALPDIFESLQVARLPGAAWGLSGALSDADRAPLRPTACPHKPCAPIFSRAAWGLTATPPDPRVVRPQKPCLPVCNASPGLRGAYMALQHTLALPALTSPVSLSAASYQGREQCVELNSTDAALDTFHGNLPP